MLRAIHTVEPDDKEITYALTLMPDLGWSLTTYSGGSLELASWSDLTPSCTLISFKGAGKRLDFVLSSSVDR